MFIQIKSKRYSYVNKKIRHSVLLRILIINIYALKLFSSWFFMAILHFF